MSETEKMKSDPNVVFHWLRINVPTLLAIGGLVWYTADNNATTLARINTIETSRQDRAKEADKKFSDLATAITVLSQKVEPIENIKYRMDRAEVQIGETNKRMDRMSETILGSLDLIRRDINGLSTKVEVLSQKVESLAPPRKAMYSRSAGPVLLEASQ